MLNGMADRFYESLPVVEEFASLTDASSYHPVPPDWLVVQADVVDSTGAIESGRYKEVNLIGAAVVAAVLNLNPEQELPFYFAGDGASVLVPPYLAESARQAVGGLQKIAAERFGMRLRAGVYPVREVIRAGGDLSVARFRYTDSYSQAMFWGNGLERVEAMLRSHPLPKPEELASWPDPDLSGLECRWQGISGQHGQIVALMIQARGDHDEDRGEIYRLILAGICRYAGKIESLRPTERGLMKTVDKPAMLKSEVRLRHGHLHGFGQMVLRWWIFIQVMVGSKWMVSGQKRLGVDWGKYFDEVVMHTDYRKFDNMLRMVISCRAEAWEQLHQFLEQEKKAGRIFFGWHVSSQAVLTCLVPDRRRRHFHFIDGAEGGYAAAARVFKRQLMH